MEKIINIIYNIVWSPVLIILLVGAGLYFTIRTRCVQIRRLGLMARLLFARPDKDRRGFSSFQAFCLALSGRVGTGNIVGVATAIAIGGPGAVFWMWLIAFLGAGTAFMESTLAQRYKEMHRKGFRGGPPYYIEAGIGKRWMGILFAIFAIIGYGFLLIMVQSNGVAAAFENSFNISPAISSTVIVILLFLVLAGGARRIADVASIVTPFMALTYIGMTLIIVVINWRALPGVMSSIIKGAFGIGPAAGGMLGSAIAMGVKRGLFSNEAGQGGGAFASGSADVPNPAQQGLVQAFSVYIDTLLVCTATAFIILCTGTDKADFGTNYVAYTQTAINSVFRGIGVSFVTISLAFFVFTTIMAYYFNSESSVVYLCRTLNIRNYRTEKALIWTARILLFTAVFLGAFTNSGLVWTIGDIGMGLTTWVNVIVLLILCPQALKHLKEFEKSQSVHRSRKTGSNATDKS